MNSTGNNNLVGAHLQYSKSNHCILNFWQTKEGRGWVLVQQQQQDIGMVCVKYLEVVFDYNSIQEAWWNEIPDSAVSSLTIECHHTPGLSQGRHPNFTVAKTFRVHTSTCTSEANLRPFRSSLTYWTSAQEIARMQRKRLHPSMHQGLGPLLSPLWSVIHKAESSWFQLPNARSSQGRDSSHQSAGLNWSSSPLNLGP